MKRSAMVLIALGVALLGAGKAFPETKPEQASIEKGKALFSDPRLGTTGRSCSTCHAGGKGLEHAGASRDLAATINKCITAALKGKTLDTASVEMQSLVLYLQDLGKAASGAAPARAPEGR